MCLVFSRRKWEARSQPSVQSPEGPCPRWALLQQAAPIAHPRRSLGCPCPQDCSWTPWPPAGSIATLLRPPAPQLPFPPPPASFISLWDSHLPAEGQAPPVRHINDAGVLTGGDLETLQHAWSTFQSAPSLRWCFSWEPGSQLENGTWSARLKAGRTPCM